MAIALIAPAKINLTLEVLRRRDDGYHEIASICQTIALADRVVIQDAVALQYQTTGPYANKLPPEPDDDLAYRAATALQRHAGVDHGAAIRIEKRVPVAAGLGGGSSNAAAILRGLNRLWSLGLTTDALCEIGAGLGSDVPLFIHGGACRLRGRGEIVEPLKDVAETPVILLVSDMAIDDKTRRMYAGLTEADFTDGGRTAATQARLATGAPASAAMLHNAFEASAARLAPNLPAALAACRDAGLTAQVCGAGPSVYVLGAPELNAGLTATLAGLGYTPVATRTLGRDDALKIEDPG
jgi:4-diphosphocytidyl-2-C-methyl-D-erythritol kinase